MRKYYIVNEEGEWLPMQGSDYFLHNTAGLGYQNEQEYQPIARGFYLPTGQGTGQSVVTGDVLIGGDAYQRRERLVRWLKAAGRLSLVYCPDSHTRLFMDMDVAYVGLPDGRRAGVLRVPIQLMGRTPFYKKEDRQIALISGEQTGRRMRFPFRFPFWFARSGAAHQKQLYITGDYPASVDAVLRGPVTAPILTAEKEDGDVLGVLDLSGVSIRGGERVHYSSRPGAERAELVAADGVSDLIPHLNLAHNNFFLLPPGERVRLTLRAEVGAGAGEVEHSIHIRQYVDY